MKNYITKTGYKKLVDELHQLSTIDYKNAIEMLQEAKDHGDLSENAEYEAAKEYHTNLLNKITLVKEKLRTSEVITQDHLSDDCVNMMSEVKIKNFMINKEQVWRLVSENEVDTKNGKISFNSPIGSSLLGKKIGDIVEVTVPSGIMKMEILDIK